MFLPAIIKIACGVVKFQMAKLCPSETVTVWKGRRSQRIWSFRRPGGNGMELASSDAMAARFALLVLNVFFLFQYQPKGDPAQRSAFGKEEGASGYGVFAAPAEAQCSWLLLTPRRFFSFSMKRKKRTGAQIGPTESSAPTWCGEKSGEQTEKLTNPTWKITAIWRNLYLFFGAFLTIMGCWN